MALEFGETVSVLDEYIEVLKQDLLFLMAKRNPERKMTQIVKVKKELDKAVQERMKLSQIYCHHINSGGVSVPAPSVKYFYDNISS